MSRQRLLLACRSTFLVGTDVLHVEEQATVDGVDARYLREDRLANLWCVIAERHVLDGHEAFQTVAKTDEGAVFTDAHNGATFHGRANRELLQEGRPRVVPQLLDAQRHLLLVVVDRQDDGFEVGALLVEVSGVVEPHTPREVGLVHHAVDAIFDADENAVIGDRANLAADLVAGLVLLGEQFPRIGLELLQAEADALGARVDLENLARDFLSDFEQLGGVLDLLRPAHLADVNEPLDAGLDLDECAVIGDRHDLAADALAWRVGLRGVVPRVCHRLLEAEGDALRLSVVLEHHDFDLVTDVEDLARMIHAAPAHVRDVKEAVDATEVDECAVLGDVLDRPGDGHAFGQGLERLCFELVPLALEQHAAAQHDVPALLVELDDLELERLPNEAIEIPDRSQVDLRTRKEGLDPPLDRHRETTLNALTDRALDEFILFTRGGDVVPHLESVGLLLGDLDQTVVALAALDEDVDVVARADDRATRGRRIAEFFDRDDAFALAPDIDDDEVALNGHDASGDNFTFTGEALFFYGGFEKCGERVCSRGAGSFKFCSHHDGFGSQARFRERDCSWGGKQRTMWRKTASTCAWGVSRLVDRF